MMMSYWSNFAKKGDPNGAGLLEWPAYNRSPSKPVMHLKANPDVTSDDNRARYELLDSLPARSRSVSENERSNENTGRLTADVLDA